MKRIKPNEGNKTFCMAPWTHTYLSPQMERRLCCSSRESSENFKQYIDTIDPKGHNDKLNLTTLEQHWNSDYMKSVRLKLMAGEEIPQCSVCNHKLLNEQVYRQHFNCCTGTSLTKRSTAQTRREQQPCRLRVLTIVFLTCVTSVVGCAGTC